MMRQSKSIYRIEGTPNSGSAAPLGVGGVADPPKHVSPRMCYHVEYGRCIRQRVWITQNWGALRPRPLGQERA